MPDDVTLDARKSDGAWLDGPLVVEAYSADQVVPYLRSQGYTSMMNVRITRREKSEGYDVPEKGKGA